VVAGAFEGHDRGSPAREPVRDALGHLEQVREPSGDEPERSALVREPVCEELGHLEQVREPVHDELERSEQVREQAVSATRCLWTKPSPSSMGPEHGEQSEGQCQKPNNLG